MTNIHQYFDRLKIFVLIIIRLRFICGISCDRKMLNSDKLIESFYKQVNQYLQFSKYISVLWVVIFVTLILLRKDFK
jgi:hypothetical protein